MLDPDPPPETDRRSVAHPFRDVSDAYRNLMALGEERIRFSLRGAAVTFWPPSLRGCSAIAAHPDPDATLVNLGKVSESLGGKGVLWELFSFNPPSLRLYVELCAYSPYLSGI